MMLPSDRYLADILGLTEEQYRHFQIEVRKRAAEGPQPAVVAGTELIIAAVSLAISVGATAVSLLFKPTIPQAGQAPGQPRQQQQTTDPIIRNTSFAPRFGFDSQQDISTLGSTIPIVYAKREEISGTTYGGIRINTPMIWNQILSLGGAQLLRAVFLLSEGNIESVDATNFGIGSNTIQGYLFDNDTITQAASRLAIYFSSDGGRIAGSDRVAGRSNSTDAGSSSSTDVFQVFRGGQNEQDFCASSRPSTQTTFGVYSPIGNNLMYKVNPVLRPGVRSELSPKPPSGNQSKVGIVCRADTQQLNQRDKFRAPFNSLGGLLNNQLQTDFAVRIAAVGDTITYKLYKDSYKNIVFDNFSDDGPNDDTDDVTALDVSSSVASMQKSWDDSLVVGEIYKIGSCLAVCTSRTDEPFVSGSDFPNESDDSSGTDVVAEFEVIRAGQIKEYTQPFLRLRSDVLSRQLSDQSNREVGTTGGHLFKYAAANIATARPCLAVEVGLRSVLGAKINGLCNFQEAKTYEQIDNNFCQAFENENPEDILNIFNQSGVVTSPLQRFSFFRIKWRVYGSTTWNDLDDTYGVRSETQQAIFNYIRFEFSTEQRREFMFEPVTGFEVRNNLDGGTTLYVLDYKKTATTVSDSSGCAVVFAGGSVARNLETFRANEGIGPDDLDDLYRYTQDTNTAEPEAELLANFTILSGQSSAQNIQLDVAPFPGNTGQGILKLPLLVGDSISGSIPATQGGNPVTINGSVTRTSGSPEESSSFTFTASTAVTADTLFSAGATFDASANNNFIRIYKGLPPVDTSSYIDDYAKLAETFVYSEITTTAKSAPEHEIVYVNEIVENQTTPVYDDLALVGINIRSSAEFQQFAQFSTYVTGGKVCNLLPLSGGTTGATHLFPEVLYDLLTNTRYGAGSLIKADMIDEASFTAAAQWCQDRKYFYDAAIAEPINIRQFAADLSATHLLQFGESDGKYFLNTALPISGSSLQVTAPIAGLFTAGNIAEDSFQLQYFDPEDRDPIQISVKYREERPSTDLNSPGLFPVVREVLVREDVPEASETDPTEQVDVSDFCTSREHAIDAAKFLIRMRRIPTHTISFATTHDAVVSSLAPGDYIKVAMDETEYDEFNNGVVTPEGALVSTKALADGTYNVVAWDGTEGTPPADTTLTVSSGGKTASPVGVVFTVKLPSTQIRVYQIERISPTDDGTFTIEALHMPVNSSGVLQVADGFDTASNWVIEG